jgi:hypothetical protein
MPTEVSDFMLSLHKKLLETDIKETTANLYLNQLYTLHNKTPFNNLGFLKHYDTIETIMKPYAETTRKAMLIAIVSSLALFKDKPTYKKAHAIYLDKLNQASKEQDAKPKNVMNDKQRENWISWDDVETKKRELDEFAETLKSQKLPLTPSQFDKLTQRLLLSLYTDQPPRRNLDYSEMLVVSKNNPMTDTTKNYYVWDDDKFIFNRYKTQSKHGQQVIDLKDTPSVLSNLADYLSHHPGFKGKRNTKTFSIPLLVNHNGLKLPNDNAITRLLNRIFKKRVGSSMLRHIYLSHKYGDKLDEMKDDADKMAHSVGQQKEYILKDAPVSGSGTTDDDAGLKELLSSIEA